MTGIQRRGRRERTSPVATAGSMSSIPAQGHFTSHVVQPKRERERKEGKIKDKEMGKMATCRWRQRLEWCYHKPSTTRGHWTLEKARKGSPQILCSVCILLTL